jgi:hypothetical protein
MSEGRKPDRLNTRKMHTFSGEGVKLYGKPRFDKLDWRLQLASAWCKTPPMFCILVDCVLRVEESASMFTSGQGYLYDRNQSESFG